MSEVPLPKEVFIDFTNNCNYKCVFCSNKSVVGRKTLRTADLGEELMSLVKAADFIDITGWGEVTTHPDFIKILKMLKELSKPYLLVTNGFLLNDESIELIKINKPKSLSISLNSLNAQNYEKIHGVSGNALEKVLSNIEKLNDKRDFFLGCSFVINTINWNELENIIRWGRDKKIHITLFDMMPSLDSYYPGGLKVEDTQKNRDRLQEINRLARQLGTSLFAFDFDKRKIDEMSKKTTIIKGCDWVTKRIFIRWDGVVTPCCWNLMEMGNVVESGINAVWNGERYTELRECLKKNDLKYCYNCRSRG